MRQPSGPDRGVKSRKQRTTNGIRMEEYHLGKPKRDDLGSTSPKQHKARREADRPVKPKP